jgi:hypothetical protein
MLPADYSVRNNARRPSRLPCSCRLRPSTTRRSTRANASMTRTCSPAQCGGQPSEANAAQAIGLLSAGAP